MCGKNDVIIHIMNTINIKYMYFYLPYNTSHINVSYIQRFVFVNI